MRVLNRASMAPLYGLFLPQALKGEGLVRGVGKNGRALERLGKAHLRGELGRYGPRCLKVGALEQAYLRGNVLHLPLCRGTSGRVGHRKQEERPVEEYRKGEYKREKRRKPGEIALEGGYFLHIFSMTRNFALREAGL